MTSPARPPLATRAALAAIWGFVMAVGLYGALRIVQSALFPEPNPATVVWTAHSGYFWRLWIVAYAGGIAACVAFVVTAHRAEGASRKLLPALSVAFLILVLQALFVP